MGNAFGKTNDTSELHNRVLKLEQVADLNGDGVVTKEELEKYATRELALRNSEIIALREEIVDLRKQKLAAEEKAEQEHAKYNALYKRHQEHLELATKNQQVGESLPISNKAIERFVDDLLADPNINIYMLPDSIEKPLYTNTLKIMLSIVQKLLNHSNIDLIGHEFKVSMQPTLETRLQDEQPSDKK